MHAQSNKIVSFPSGNDMTYALHNKKTVDKTQLASFINDWEAWSKLVKNGAVADSRENAIFADHFIRLTEEENQKRKNPIEDKYIVLPQTVMALFFDDDIYPEDKCFDIFDVMKSKTPVSISYFTPVIDTEATVLYLTDKIKEIMYQYIRQDDPARTVERLDEIREYIPCGLSHWWNDINLLAMPNIHRILIGKDGYYLDVHWGDFYGSEFFITNEGERMLIAEWIQ